MQRVVAGGRKISSPFLSIVVDRKSLDPLRQTVVRSPNTTLSWRLRCDPRFESTFLIREAIRARLLGTERTQACSRVPDLRLCWPGLRQRLAQAARPRRHVCFDGASRSGRSTGLPSPSPAATPLDHDNHFLSSDTPLLQSPDTATAGCRLNNQSSAIIIITSHLEGKLALGPHPAAVFAASLSNVDS
jgi:hypothetical protein